MKKLIFLMLLTPFVNAGEVDNANNNENNLTGFRCAIDPVDIYTKGIGNCEEGDIITDDGGWYFLRVCKFESVKQYGENRYTCILNNEKDFVILRDRYKYPKK